MFNVGGGEIMVVLLLALLVLGPDKLPEYTRKVGRFMAEFRHMTSGFQDEFRNAMDLGASDASKGSGDALSRATDGPRLAAAPPPVTDAAAPAPAPVEANDADQGSGAEPPALEGPGATAPADAGPASESGGPQLVTPPAPGPELITPGRPSPAAEVAPVDPDGGHGSSTSAA
jgi:sec-independent protein translocase protein TatB